MCLARSSSSWTGRTALMRCWCCSGRDCGGLSVPFLCRCCRILDVWVLSPLGIDSGQHLAFTPRAYLGYFWHMDGGLRMATGFRILRIGPAVKPGPENSENNRKLRVFACRKVLHARHWQATKELRELWIVIGAVSETTLASTWSTFVDFAEITARLTRFKTLIWVGVMLIFVAWQV